VAAIVIRQEAVRSGRQLETVHHFFLRHYKHQRIMGADCVSFRISIPTSESSKPLFVAPDLGYK